MAEKKTYWMRTPDGAKALVTGTDDRDAWTFHGLSEADEPQSGEFVWLEHDQHHGRQKFTADVVEQFAAKGWHPSPPVEPVDVTKDPRLTDVEETPAKSADKPDEKSTKSAASRKQNEE